MAGIKGRSGRKSRREEIDIAELYTLSVKIVRDYLENPKIKQSAKTKIALEIVKKSMPQTINLGGQKDNPVEIDLGKMTKDEIGKYLLAKLRG